MPGGYNPGGGGAGTPTVTANAPFPGTTAFNVLFGTHASLDPELMTGLSSPGKPVDYAQAVASLVNLSQDQLYSVQQMMYAAGLLTKQSDVTGTMNIDAGDPTLVAWRKVVDSALIRGLSPFAVLRASATQGSYTQVESELAKQLGTLQERVNIASTTGVPANLTDSTALRDIIQATANQIDGYGASDQFINQFIANFHAQEVSAAKTQRDALLAGYQTEENRVKAEQSQLTKLGPDGIDSFLQAWRSVVAQHAAQLGVTPQGPQTGGSLIVHPSGAPGGPVPPAGTAGAPAPGTPGGPPGGAVGNTGTITPGQAAAQARTVGPGGGVFGGLSDQSIIPALEGWATGGIIGLTQGGGGGAPAAPTTAAPVGAPGPAAPTAFTSTAPPGAGVQPGLAPQQVRALPPGLAQTLGNFYGGVYGLSRDAWDAGLTHLGYPTAQYPSPSAAPLSVQTSIASWYAQQQYNKYQDWGDVASVMATGKPLSQAGGAPIFGRAPNGALTMSDLATQVVNEVNQALATVQTSITAAGNAPVVARVTPNAPAEAAAALRNADPVQAIAHSASELYGVLDAAIAGIPTIQAKPLGAAEGVTGMDVGTPASAATGA